AAHFLVLLRIKAGRRHRLGAGQIADLAPTQIAGLVVLARLARRLAFDACRLREQRAPDKAGRVEPVYLIEEHHAASRSIIRGIGIGSTLGANAVSNSASVSGTNC